MAAASIEDISRTLLKAAKDIEKQAAAANVAISKTSIKSTPLVRKKSAFVSFESQLMNSFHVGDPIQNQISIAKFLLSETGCQGCVMIRVIENNLFRLYFRGGTPCPAPETYHIDDFVCLHEVIRRKEEVFQSDEDFQALSLLVQWKPLFTHIPDVVLAIPVLRVDQQMMAIIGLGFKKRLPQDFMANKFPSIRDFIDTVVPYAMTIQATSDYDEESMRMKLVLESMTIVDKEKRDPIKCATTIGTELGNLTGCQNVSVFTVDYADNRLLKVYPVGKQKYQWGCPFPDCHDKDCFEFNDRLPLGWAALYRKTLKINDSAEIGEYNLTKKSLHSVRMCFCRNVMCIPLNDHSGEKPLVVELVDKEGGFTSRDVEVASLFIQNAASVYSCCVMLAHRERSCRRNSMLSQILLNIEPVKHTKVEQFLSHQRRTSVDTLFAGPFMEFHFSIKSYSEWDMAGGILFAFTDLDMLSTFKIRRATLIRFILSAQQGYRILPYHNWQHACSVAHFGYLLIKRLKLLENGYLTRLQAFAILVSGIVHDIDHRGTNNRFQSCTNSDLFQLYNTQDSILERHHLSIALSILRREDCNLIENLSPEDYKEFIELLTWNVLATDISKYLQTRETNFQCLRNFTKGDRENTYALLALMMTACDVNDCVKAWEDNLISARQILTEFFEQGEMEKEMGMQPMPMMDRSVAYIPEVEFKFISGIVMPVYVELATAFPDLQQCVKALRRVEDYWEYSTIVFDQFPDVENKLDILKMPEMKEENLKKIGDDKGKFKIKRFSEGVYKDERRGTIAVDIKRTFASKAIHRPESEFRSMFTDKEDRPTSSSDEIGNEILDGEKEKNCYGCRKSKNNKSKPKTTTETKLKSKTKTTTETKSKTEMETKSKTETNI